MVSIGKAYKRLQRTAVFGAVAYPYALVTIPLAVVLWFFAVAAMHRTFFGQDPWALRQVFQCIVCTSVITLFSVLAFGYLIAVVVMGWRDSAWSESQQ